MNNTSKQIVSLKVNDHHFKKIINLDEEKLWSYNDGFYH